MEISYLRKSLLSNDGSEISEFNGIVLSIVVDILSIKNVCINFVNLKDLSI